MKKILSLLCMCSIVLCTVQYKRNPAEEFKSKGGLRVVFEMDQTSGSIPDSIYKQTMDILQKRIEYFGTTPHIKWLENQKHILVEIPKVKTPEYIVELMQSNASLEFWETYSFQEIGNIIFEADTILGNEHPLLSRLQFHNMPTSPIVGSIEERDIEKVMDYLNRPQVKALFPSDLKFSLAAKPVNGRYDLYTLRTGKGYGAALTGEVITKAKTEECEWGGYLITLRMNPAGALIWERLTEKNIGRCIALSMDNYVYSAPTVNSKIIGGNSSISGNLTLEEADSFASLLNAGKLPLPVKVVSQEVVPPLKK